MTAALINIFAGLIVGLLSGFCFERRATNAAKAHSQELEHKLAQIGHSVLSVGGSMNSSIQTADASFSDELLVMVRNRALSIQNSEGRVAKSSLTTYFSARGHSNEALITAVRELCDSGQAREVDKWLILT